MATMTALIVDDSDSMRQLLVYAVQRIPGLNAIEATNGVEALTHAAAAKPDIVITDINMPVMDGLKLVQRLRDDAQFKDIPIVVVTTESGAEDRARAMELGASAYITKPIQGPKVVKLLKELLGL